MEIKSKMVQFLLCTTLVSMVCSCAKNDELVENKTSLRKLPQSSIDYGTLHNEILDACLAECQNQINPDDYVSVYVNYELYAAYSNIIARGANDYAYRVYGDTVPFGVITCPGEYWNQWIAQYSYMSQNLPGADSAFNLTIQLFDDCIDMVYGGVEVNETYWTDLIGNIDNHLWDIYYQCEPLCATIDEREALEVMCSVMAGSCAYWSDTTKMEAWRELAWNAQCQYLNLRSLDESAFEQYRIDYKMSTKEKVKEFVVTDGMAALSAAYMGPHCALSAAGLFSAIVALSWD